MTPLQRARALPHRVRVLALLALAALVLVIAFLVPPIPQPAAYHNFADPRPLWGLANFGDVASNAPFLLVGALGLVFLFTASDGAGSRQSHLRLPFMIYFLGVMLVALGSAYYHENPTNETLFWDRLPMTIAFMAFFSAIIADRIHQRSGLALLLPLIVLGIASVVYWAATERAGAGDLRPYAIVQFFPMLAIILIIVLFPPRTLDARHIVIMGGFYALAKLFEHFDQAVFDLLGGGISGHSLKHLAAAAAAYMALPLLKQPVPDSLYEEAPEGKIVQG